MNVNKVLLFVFLGVLVASMCYADDFSIIFEPVTERIMSNENAIINLTINSNMDKTAKFSIYTTDVEWNVETDPSLDRIVDIEPYGSRNVKIVAKPLSFTYSGTYTLHLRVKDLATNEVQEKTAMINIRREGTNIAEVTPNVITRLYMKKEVDPREDVVVKVNVENHNPLNLTHVRVLVRSNLINQEHITTLNPYEKKTLEFVAKLDPLQEPGEDLLQVFTYVNRNNKIYDFVPAEETYEIIKYGEIKSDETIDKRFLKKDAIYTVKNEANTDNIDVFKVKRSLLKEIFVSTKPDAEKIKEDGIRYYAWRLSMDKDESTEIHVITNFRPFAIVLLIIIIATILYYLLRSPVVIKKRVAIIERKEGGISRLNIQLEVINRTKKNVQNLEITDKLPNIMELEGEFKVGTLQPNKILRHDKKGTIMKWEIGDLNNYEERIIAYKAHAKLSVIGRFVMPVTLGKFNVEGKDKDRNICSNRLVLKI